MKKTLTSALFIAAFAGYALFQNSAIPASNTASASTIAQAGTLAAPAKKTPTVATAQPATPARPKGIYNDGTYTGSSADAYYGYVQVRVTVSGGKIARVSFLDYPQDRGTSRSINSFAIPQLTREAISAQSANVSGVSGASDTSAAFKQSLSSALAQAKV